jgi:hypothetical protein
VHAQRLVSAVKMATMLEGCSTEEQGFVVFFLWAKGLSTKVIHKEMFPLHGGKCFSCKVVHNWVKKFSQRRSKVTDDARPDHPVEIATEATVLWAEEFIRVDRRIMTESVATTLGCSHGLAYRIMPSTKKFKVMPSAGKVMLCVFWDSQGVLLAHFQKHGKNVNYALYCVVLLKLRDAIHRKYPGQLARGVVLHHDNARPHTAQATQERIQELQWDLLEHLPYSPDFAPSDLHVFCLLKKNLGGKRFADDKQVEMEV